MIFGLYPVTVVILIITTSLNAALATDKRNSKRWINVICTIVGLVGIIYSSVYGA